MTALQAWCICTLRRTNIASGSVYGGRSNSLHRSLADLSQRAHTAAVEGEQAQGELLQVEEEIDQQAARLWGITKGELTKIRQALAELA